MQLYYPRFSWPSGGLCRRQGWRPALLLSVLGSLAFSSLAQAPAVTAVSPARNLRSAPTGSPVGVTFSQAISAASAANVRVYSSRRGGQRVRSGGGTVSGGGTAQVGFAPAQPWQPGETVSVSVPATVQSTTGVPATPHVFQFMAAAGSSGGGVFASSFGSEVTMGQVYPQSVTTGDVDGDGDLDLLTTISSQDRVRIDLNAGNGTFGTSFFVSTANYPTSTTLGDVDGDGDLDMVVIVGSSGATAGVSIFTNNGSGSFTSTGTVLVGQPVNDIALGDIDGDGDLDIATANFAIQPAVNFLLNSGSGTFTTSANTLVMGNGLNDVALGDVDNDGDLDLLAVANNPGQFYVRLNDGSGSFSGSAFVNGADFAGNLALGDIDGDGDLDAVLSKTTLTASLSIYRNNGSGGFTHTSLPDNRPTLFEIGNAVTIRTAPTDVALGDVNGDGTLDIVVLTRINTKAVFNGSEFEGRGEIRVWDNNGSGTFSPGGATSVGIGPSSMAVGDLDGDQDLDLLANSTGFVSNATTGTVSVRLNGASVSSLTTGPISQPSTCRSTSVDVPFTAVGSFDISNVFTAQLSDASGSFAAPVSIGVLRGTVPGTIPAFIPANTALGTGYRIRVVSNHLPFTGTDNGTDLTVFEFNATNLAATATPNPVASGGTLSLDVTGSAASLPGLTYAWTGPNAFTSNLRNPQLTNVTTASDGLYRVTVTGGCAFSSTVDVTVTPPTITTGNPLGGATQFCAGSTIAVPFTTSGPLRAGNTFTLTLVAHGTGSTIQIGTMSGTGSGTITGVIPNSQVNATTYRVRVGGVFSTPTLVENPTDLTVTNLNLTNPALNVVANTPVAEGADLNLDVANVPLPGATFAWTGPNGFTASTQNPTVPAVTTAAAGGYSVTVSLNGCTRTTSRGVSVTPTPRSITVSSLAAGTYCAGAAISVPFTAAGSYAAGNVFTAQLSDAVGGFGAGAVNLGTLAGTAGGTISGIIPAGATGSSLYRVRVVASSPATTAATTQPLSITAAGTVAWLGGTSTDWLMAANWSCGQVPTATDNVTIGPGATYYPVVTGASATVRDLTVAAGASFAVTGTLTVRGSLTNNGTWTTGGSYVFAGTSPQLVGGTTPVGLGNVTITAGAMVQLMTSLPISGNWLNNGAFDAGQYRVTCLGTTSQTLGGSSATRFYDLTIQNAAGVSCTAPTGVAHLLALPAGNLAADGFLTLYSNAAGTAMVVNPVGGGRVTGRATMERFITGAGSAGYRHYASPMALGTATVQEFADDLPVFELNPAYNTQGNTVTPFPTFYQYDESRLASAATDNFSQGWLTPLATDNLVPGRGYSAQTGPTTTVDISGTLSTGTVSLPLTRGGQSGSGWNLVGNPYPAPIDWDLVPAVPGLDKALYVFVPSGPYTGTYGSYVNGIGQNGGGKDVAAMQGFFVRATAATTLSLTDAVRHTSYLSPGFNRGSTTATLPLLRLHVRNAAGQGDETVVYFDPSAGAGFRSDYDAYKVHLNGNGIPSVWSQAGPDALSINGLPDLTAAAGLPLGVRVSQTGTHTLAASALLNLPAGTQVVLEDRLLNQRQNLTVDSAYSFQMADSYTGQRFYLWFQGRALANATGQLDATASLYPNPATGTTTLELRGLREQGAVTIEVLNALGQRVLAQSTRPRQGAIRQELAVGHLPTGVYSVRVRTADGTVVRRLLKQ